MENFIRRVNGGKAYYRLSDEHFNSLSENGVLHPEGRDLVYMNSLKFKGEEKGLEISNGRNSIVLDESGSISYL